MLSGLGELELCIEEGEGRVLKFWMIWFYPVSGYNQISGWVGRCLVQQVLGLFRFYRWVSNR